MSELRVETISNNAGTGPVTLTGQVAAKAACSTTGTYTGVADDINIASITDNGTGDFSLTFTNAFTGTNYGVSGLGADFSPRIVSFSRPSASVVDVEVYTATPNNVDANAAIQSWGTLA